MRSFWIVLAVLFAAAVDAAVVDEPIKVQGHFLELELHPREGGVMHNVGLVATVGNLAGGEGLLPGGGPERPGRPVGVAHDLLFDLIAARLKGNAFRKDIRRVIAGC